MTPYIITDIDLSTAERTIMPSDTYAVDFAKGTVSGRIDGKEALRQSIYRRLQTVSGEHPIYSDGYGLPMNELIGQPTPLVYVNAAAAISRTLLEDDRITAVGDFVFTRRDGDVSVSFRVDTVFGAQAIKEVTIDV